MRVTKTIKDYVTRTVKEIYSEPLEEEKAYFALEEKISAEIDKINEKFKPLIRNDMEAFNLANGLTKENGGLSFKDEEHICSYNFYRLGNSELGQRRRKAKETREKKINEAIENIILTLELGGNKADLDRMLNELKENK